jgi:hypothetical protein
MAEVLIVFRYRRSILKEFEGNNWACRLPCYRIMGNNWAYRLSCYRIMLTLAANLGTKKVRSQLFYKGIVNDSPYYFGDSSNGW